MELVHLHTMEPLSAALVADTLVEAVPQALLDPRGALQVRIHGPWRPADRWPGGIERLLWTARFELPRDRFLRTGIEADLVRRGLARRDHPVHPGEALARRLGSALLVTWSDAAQLVDTVIFRERRLAWSLLLQGTPTGREEPEEAPAPVLMDGPGGVSWDSGELEPPPPTSRVIRCDGHVVTVEAPAGELPEGDRTGILLAALNQYFREPLWIDPSELYTLPDALDAWDAAAEPVWVARDGQWAPVPGQRAGRPTATNRVPRAPDPRYPASVTPTRTR